ncbi:MAG: tetratricopeptide repeat protein [Cyanobacteria bacterium J06621_8]
MKPRLNNWLQELDADAAEEYNALRRSLQRNNGFGLFFVQCSPATGSDIIAGIKEDISHKKIDTLHFDQAIDSLYGEITAIPNLKEIDILFISGLEHSLIEYENYTFNSNGENSNNNTEKRLTQDRQGVPRFLGYLNLQRDRFREEFATSFVFIVPIFGIDYFIKRAPDFFDWRSGLFRFIPQKERLLDYDYDNISQKKYLQSRQELLDLKTLSKELEFDVTEKLKFFQKEFFLLINCNCYQEAIESCNSILKINPEEDIGWLSRGYALGKLERYEEAITDYDKCLEINPEADIVWLSRGYALGKLERYEEAITDYDKCLEINPEKDSAWFCRGDALGELERYEEAISNYDKCLEINPKKDSAWFYRGLILGRLERCEEAISSFDRCLEINPEHDTAWFIRGSALDELERHEEAIVSYDKALIINPNEYFTWSFRGNALSELARYEEAISSFEKGLAINSNDDLGWYSRACCLAILNRVNLAIESLAKAISLDQEWQEKAKDDRDFDNIRNDEKFQFLINSSLELKK